MSYLCPDNNHMEIFLGMTMLYKDTDCLKDSTTFPGVFALLFYC